jgi:protein ImuA
MPAGKAATLERLRTQIAGLEKRPALAGDVAFRGMAGDLLPVPAGMVHEIFTDELRNSGTVLGFALGAAQTWLKPERPVILMMQLTADSREMGVPYGPGLKSFGLDSDAVILTRTDTVTEFLWTIEEAVSSTAVAAVIADIASHQHDIDFTVSRRLVLRAAATSTSVYLVRYGTGREASAAKYRWKVLPTPSGSPPFDARAPGSPRFAVTLEKGQIAGFSADRSLLMDWTADGFALVEHGRKDGLPARGAAPISGADPAAMGDRLSLAG